MMLDDYQTDAVKRMRNGCILCGGVGSGKSLTSLVYYFEKICKGKINGRTYRKRKNNVPLYIITTARKRDDKEWESELAPFLISSEEVVVDSWNNIGKYTEIKSAFFIFDEQRVVSYGSWTKSFLKIVKKNEWILLSATPGDNWSDYIPVFIANGFYHNKSEFLNEHVVYKRFTSFPQIDKYIGTKKLEYFRDQILVTMDYHTPAHPNHIDVFVAYNKKKYKHIFADRWDPYDDCPIDNPSKLCYLMRRCVNEDHTRLEAVAEILEKHEKTIIFYNFDYELELLDMLCTSLGKTHAQWNGHKHEAIPECEEWVYLVQYTAGAEGWNCTKTDTIIFFSQNYSYKIMVQSAGRTDRRNTPYKELYYYHLKSRAPIDLAISRVLNAKSKFNENKFLKSVDRRSYA